MDTETAKRIIDAQTARDVAFLEAFRLARASTSRMSFGAPWMTDWSRGARPWPLPVRIYFRPTGPQAGSDRT